MVLHTTALTTRRGKLGEGRREFCGGGKGKEREHKGARDKDLRKEEKRRNNGLGRGRDIHRKRWI